MGSKTTSVAFQHSISTKIMRAFVLCFILSCFTNAQDQVSVFVSSEKWEVKSNNGEVFVVSVRASSGIFDGKISTRNFESLLELSSANKKYVYSISDLPKLQNKLLVISDGAYAIENDTGANIVCRNADGGQFTVKLDQEAYKKLINSIREAYRTSDIMMRCWPDVKEAFKATLDAP